MDTSPNTATVQYGGLAPALAVAIAIVGANGFADAAGIHENYWGQGPARPLCAIVLFVLSWMLLRFLFQLATQTVWRLGQVGSDRDSRSRLPFWPVARSVCWARCSWSGMATAAT